MYTTTNKGFTVITNFGCNQNCKYCITKYHPILRGRVSLEEDIDWNHLEKCISETKASEVNLSGGGDPFFEWRKHRNFYFRIYEIAKRYRKNLAVHTRIIPLGDIELLNLFSKFAITVEYYNEKSLLNLKHAMPYFQGAGVGIRVIQVVDEKMTRDDCESYVRFLKTECSVPRITFREMFGSVAAQANFAKLKGLNLGEGVMFLPDDDYHNYYFLHNNTLYPYFFGQHKEDRLNIPRIC